MNLDGGDKDMIEEKLGVDFGDNQMVEKIDQKWVFEVLV